MKNAGHSFGKQKKCAQSDVVFSSSAKMEHTNSYDTSPLFRQRADTTPLIYDPSPLLPFQGVAELHSYEPSPLLSFQFQRQLQESLRKDLAFSYEPSPLLAFAGEVRSAGSQLPSPVASSCISHVPLDEEQEDRMILYEA